MGGLAIFMNWEIWIPLFIAISAWIPKIIEWLANRNQSNAQFANTIMEGGTKALNAVTHALDEYQEQNKELKAEIDGIKTARKEREVEHTAEIDELKARIQADVMETSSLRNDYANAQRKLLEQDRQIQHHEDLIISLGEYIEAHKKALEGANIPVPTNGKLLESVYKLKALREAGK